MAIFRKRADRIRGVAGSYDGAGVLVVDGTHGPGPGITRVFAEAGAHVVIASPDSPAVDIQLRRLSTSATPPTGIATGLGTQQEHTALVDSLEPIVTTYVLNPTTYNLGETNALGPQNVVVLAQALADRLRDQGRSGNIVFITGIKSARADTTAIAFLTAAMEQLAAVMAPNSIRVNAIAPGHIGSNRRGNSASSRVSPLGHVAVHPIEIGKAAWFLANDDLSAGITGTTLKIDRGASLLRPEW